MPNTNQSRRSFLKETTLLVAGLSAGVLGCATGLRIITLPSQDGRIVVDTSEIKELAAVGGAVQIGSERTGDPLFLIRTGVAEYTALSSVCTHLGCQVRNTRFGFRCPCHGSAFDTKGQVVTGPANEPLPSYVLEVSGTVVTIQV